MMRNLILKNLALCAFLLCACSNNGAPDNGDNAKILNISTIPDVFQGQWVKDPAACYTEFGAQQINILADQLVFKTGIARPTALQIGGRALYVTAKMDSESGVQDVNYKFIISADGKSLVSSDGIERFKCVK